MASWFYLYLYTEEKPQFTTKIDSTVTKVTHIQEGRNMARFKDYNNIEIDEGTSHWIDATVKNDDGTTMSLAGCTAIFTAGPIEKTCLIDNNHITIKLEPEDTTGYLSSGYQIRIFDANDDVFQIIQGYIYIRKAHKPYIQKPLNEGVQINANN